MVALLLLVFSPTIECGMAALQSAAAHLTAGYPLDTRGVELLLRLLHAAAYKIYAMRDRCGAVACQVSLFGGEIRCRVARDMIDRGRREGSRAHALVCRLAYHSVIPPTNGTALEQVEVGSRQS